LLFHRLYFWLTSILLLVTLNSGAQTPAATTPKTNVGATSNSNVQNLDLTPTNIPTKWLSPTGISKSAGTISFDSAGAMLIDVCRDPSTTTAMGRLDRDSYALINAIRLNDPDTNNAQSVASNNWYVFSKKKGWYNGWPHGWTLADFDGATRLYGARHVLQVSILINEQHRPQPQIDFTYTVTKATPTNVANVQALLGVVIPSAAGAKPPAPPNTDPTSYWACSGVPIAYSDSSIKVDTKYPADEASAFSASTTFTSEAKQYWDVSFALPIKKASALQYSSTDNTVVPSQINKQSLFATADLYFPPTNLAGSGHSLIPHVFAGVAMNQQPLHSLLFGGAVGFNLAQVYAGVLLLKQQQLAGLAGGGTATPSQLATATTYGFTPSFSVGLKISIVSAVKSLSKSK
jgi:hypothetical protein